MRSTRAFRRNQLIGLRTQFFFLDFAFTTALFTTFAKILQEGTSLLSPGSSLYDEKLYSEIDIVWIRTLVQNGISSMLKSLLDQIFSYFFDLVANV